jgi:hypothetical protein
MAGFQYCASIIATTKLVIDAENVFFRDILNAAFILLNRGIVLSQNVNKILWLHHQVPVTYFPGCITN